MPRLVNKRHFDNYRIQIENDYALYYLSCYKRETAILFATEISQALPLLACLF